MLNLPFLFRKQELKLGASHLAPGQVAKSSRLLIIRGESGTGKSAFCRALLRRLVADNRDVLCIHLDVRDDEFFTSHLFECLSYLCWNDCPWDNDTARQVPKGTSFLRFLKDYRVRKDLIGYLHGIATTAADLLPGFASKLAGAIPSPDRSRSEHDPVPDIASAFLAYLRKVAARHVCYMALDNYQFLPASVRLLLETQLASFTTNLGLLFVDRTLEGTSEIPRLTVFSARQQNIDLQGFTEAEIEQLVCTVARERSDCTQVARHCYLSTSGNLKEVEFYLTRFFHEGGAGERPAIEAFLQTIGKLPELHRNLLALVALFPAGLKLKHLNEVLSMLCGPDCRSELQQVAQTLAVLGYIVINSQSGETVRPAHEKVITAVRQVVTDREVLLVRKTAIEVFDDLLSKGLARNEYAYILHCLVGILTGREYEQRLDRIVWLIDLQYKADKFSYVANLYRHLSDNVLVKLPEHTIEEFLDSFQKTSEFHLGMTVVTRLRSLGVQSEHFDRALVRYLTQTYRYEDALELLEKLPPADDLMMYKLTVLLYLGREKEARAIIERFLRRAMTPLSAIALRNSAHLYPYEAACVNVTRALDFFRDVGWEFETATCLNNLGILFLWKGEAQRAVELLEEASSSLAGLASNEVYQPLINLGVAALLQGRGEASLSLFAEARRWLPNTLLLDQLILDANVAVAELVQGSVTIEKAEAYFAELSREARKIDDRKLHDHIGFNFDVLRRLLRQPQQSLVSQAFLDGVKSRSQTGFECFIDVDVEGGRQRFLLALSPHWRY